MGNSQVTKRKRGLDKPMTGRKPLVGVPPDGTHSFGGTTYGVPPYEFCEF